MTESEVADFLRLKERAESYCFVSADGELQAVALEAVEQEITRLEGSLRTAQADATLPDIVPNTIYCAQQLLYEVRQELLMWIAIRQQNFNVAWDHMVIAQSLLRRAFNSCYMLTKVSNRLRMLECLQWILFPPQVFLSPGIIAICNCSICGERAQSCNHVRGRLYRGHLCRYVAETADLIEVSIVGVPADKRRRITTFTDGDITKDKLTNGPVTAGHGETLGGGGDGMTCEGRVI